MRRAFVSIPFAFLLGLALWTSRGEAQSESLVAVADGVWFRMGEREYGHCNNVVIEMADGLFVVDANFPSGAEALMRDIARVSKKRVKWVFDTHHHGDHAYGNPLWTRAGATTIAHANVVAEIGRYEPARWREAAQERPDVGRLNLDTLEPPAVTFDRSPYVIEDATRRIELHHFGWAHTRGDGFAYLPKEKILCSGDAAVNGPFNYTGDGNSGNWPNVLAGALKLDVQKVLPGHGPAGGLEIVRGQAAFFTALNERVGRAHAAGKKLEDLVPEMRDGRGVRTTVELPAAVRNWVGPNLAEQVRVRYAELAEGRPHGEILGGK